MDDGNGYKKSSAFRISTYAFGHRGSQILTDCLNKNFGIRANLVRDSKGYQIYIPAKDGNSIRFSNLINPYIIPSMRYKLEHRSPVETHMADIRSQDLKLNLHYTPTPRNCGDEDIVRAPWKHGE